MKLPANNELLRIIAAAGITLLAVALAVMFFMWVFSSPDREHRRVQPLAVSSSTQSSRSISASWRSILPTSRAVIANSTMMPVKATENPIICSTAVSIFLPFYHLAAAASTIGTAFPQSNCQSLYELTNTLRTYQVDRRYAG
jgi:hypothetical protein